MRKMKRWKSTFGVLALALLLTVSLAPTAAFADEAAAGEAAAGTGTTEKKSKNLRWIKKLLHRTMSKKQLRRMINRVRISRIRPACSVSSL